MQAGARGVHTSVNGMGERAGNTLPGGGRGRDPRPHRSAARRSVNESRLVAISRAWSSHLHRQGELAANAPIVGRDVFTQTAGIHADGDAKGDLYGIEASRPTRFGRREALRARKAVRQGVGRPQPRRRSASRSHDPRTAIWYSRTDDRARRQASTPFRKDGPPRTCIADVLKSPAEQLVKHRLATASTWRVGPSRPGPRSHLSLPAGASRKRRPPATEATTP